MDQSPPFKVAGIDHVVLIVDDMEKAIQFYENVLGARIENDLRKIGMMQLRAGTSMIDLVDTACQEGAWARPSVRGGRNMDHMALAVDGVEEAALRAHMESHGVEIYEEGIRVGARGKGYSWYIHDPFGNAIELKGP